jgi:hypothetical protein
LSAVPRRYHQAPQHRGGRTLPKAQVRVHEIVRQVSEFRAKTLCNREVDVVDTASSSSLVTCGDCRKILENEGRP